MPSLTFNCIGDGYIFDRQPNTNFQGPTLKSGGKFIDSTNQPEYKSHLKFDFSQLPNNAIVKNVTLNINLISVEQTHTNTSKIGAVLDNFNPNTVTWNTSPNDYIYGFGTSFAYINPGQKNIDITKVFLSSIQYDSIAIGDFQDGGIFTWGSKESANPPSITIEYELYQGEKFDCISNATRLSDQTGFDDLITSPAYLKFRNINVPVNKILKSVSLNVATQLAPTLEATDLSVLSEAFREGVSNNIIVDTLSTLSVQYQEGYTSIDVTQLYTEAFNKSNDYGIAIKTAIGRRIFNRYSFRGAPFLVVEFDDKPPAPPVITLPVQSASVDAAKALKVSWLTSEAQTGFVIGYSTDGVNFTEINVTSTNRYYEFAPNFFSLGLLYIRVKIKVGLVVGENSQIRLLNVVNRPTAPTNLTSGTIDGALPLLSADGVDVKEYDIILLDGTTELINETIEGTSISYQILNVLENNKTYTFKTRYKDSTGLYSDYTQSSINTVFVIPQEGTITLTDKGYYLELLTTGGTSTRRELYKQVEGEYIRIANMEQVDNYNDFFVKSNQNTNYFVRSFSNTNGYIDSQIYTESLKFEDSYLITIDTILGLELKYEPRKSETVSRLSNKYNLVNRTAPFQIFSTIIDNYMDSLSFLIFDKQDIDTLKKIATYGEICCFRDGRGTLVYIIIKSLKINHDQFGRYTVSISTDSVDYDEVI